MGNVLPDDKIAPVLRNKGSAKSLAPDDNKIWVVVKYFKDAHSGMIEKVMGKFGAELVGALPEMNEVTISIPEKRITDLARENDIRWIEPVVPPGVGETYRIGFREQADDVSRDLGLSGKGVIIGIFDASHVYRYHQDFSRRVRKGDTDPTFYGSHATNVAGLIGGNGSIVPGFRGIAPDVDMYTYSYASGGDPIGERMNYVRDLLTAIKLHNIDIANNSWGTAGCDIYDYGDYIGLCSVIDCAVHGDLGRPIIAVFSAGNERSGNTIDGELRKPYNTRCLVDVHPPFINYGTMNHPKSAKNALVVGAIDSYDDAMSSYSCWGPTIDGRLKPELVASGHHRGFDKSGVSVPRNIEDLFGAASSSHGKANYGYFGLTSCAAATASGCLALLLEESRILYSTRAAMLPSTAKALLIHTAKDLDDSTLWYNKGPDYAAGYGLLQIMDAVDHLRHGFFMESLVDQNQLRQFSMDVPSASGCVKITLVWDDPPSVENNDRSLINDLDLVVIDPNGNRHYPWTLDPDNPSEAAVKNKRDNRNNIEQVLVDSMVSHGTWKIIIKGESVPEGPQSFSLIAGEKFSEEEYLEFK
jgi:hypothetical protein